MTTYRVVVRRLDETDEHVVATGKTERTADRVADGVDINLDHDNWTTCIEEET